RATAAAALRPALSVGALSLFRRRARHAAAGVGGRRAAAARALPLHAMAGASRRPVKRGHAAKAQSRARAPGQSRGPAPGRAVRRVRVGDLSPLLGARAGAARRGPLARGGLAPVLRPGRPRSHAGVARRTPRGGTMSAGSLRRIGVSARLVARDLARNRVAVALLVVIPIVFYGLVAATTGDRDKIGRASCRERV